MVIICDSIDLFFERFGKRESKINNIHVHRDHSKIHLSITLV